MDGREVDTDKARDRAWRRWHGDVGNFAKRLKYFGISSDWRREKEKRYSPLCRAKVSDATSCTVLLSRAKESPAASFI